MIEQNAAGNTLLQVRTESEALPAIVRSFDMLAHSKTRVWAAGLVCAATIATSTFVGTQTADAISLIEQTTAPVPADPVEIEPTNFPEVDREKLPLEIADVVRVIHDESGFTWEQLSRAFGVSRRSMHLWASGARINARHSEMLMHFAELVRSTPVKSPEQVRSWFHASKPGVGSPLEVFQARYRKGAAPVQSVGYTPSQLLGTESD
ncbi:hypothetical protein NX801_25375 [Streptomyces sp. LP05-1]|uniref:Uncharacterized protein n=1 Tax=Streptomyces pyxinae TaxID=2970734 RepID=A0ABT2CN99_9ACTN|nr:hypothetical protein [Streptomyces sp. LP05-1]MCS0638920.1 hypothetical protein [Streptomyces sp. LP05-1]